MASRSLHQIRLFSLLPSKIYLNVHQKIIVNAAHPPQPSPEQTTLVSAHLACDTQRPGQDDPPLTSNLIVFIIVFIICFKCGSLGY